MSLADSFDGAAPVVCNTLPVRLHSASISRWQFRDGLKTRLLLQACAWSSEKFSFKSLCTYLLTYIKISECWFEKEIQTRLCVSSRFNTFPELLETL